MGDFLEAIAGNDRRKALEALRDQIAWKLDAGECRHCGGPRGEAAGLASLALRLMKVFEALDALPSELEVSPRDDIAARRAARRRAAAEDSLDPDWDHVDGGGDGSDGTGP